MPCATQKSLTGLPQDKQARINNNIEQAVLRSKLANPTLDGNVGFDIGALRLSRRFGAGFGLLAMLPARAARFFVAHVEVAFFS